MRVVGRLMPAIAACARAGCGVHRKGRGRQRGVDSRLLIVNRVVRTLIGDNSRDPPPMLWE